MVEYELALHCPRRRQQQLLQDQVGNKLKNCTAAGQMDLTIAIDALTWFSAYKLGELESEELI